MQLVVAVVQVNEPGVEVTVYPVIAEPFASVEAVHETVAWPLPATALTEVGALGTPAGVTLDVAVEAVESPTAFVAMTVKV
jgi:hypothetical protein